MSSRRRPWRISQILNWGRSIMKAFPCGRKEKKWGLRFDSLFFKGQITGSSIWFDPIISFDFKTRPSWLIDRLLVILPATYTQIERETGLKRETKRKQMSFTSMYRRLKTFFKIKMRKKETAQKLGTSSVRCSQVCYSTIPNQLRIHTKENDSKKCL